LVQVGEIKAQIAELKAFPLEGMKLIFAGAVLTDAQVLSATTIKDNDFVVCVVKKAVRLAGWWRIALIDIRLSAV
jgi:F420-0:gamma-glutamyl ligase